MHSQYNNLLYSKIKKYFEYIKILSNNLCYLRHGRCQIHLSSSRTKWYFTIPVKIIIDMLILIAIQIKWALVSAIQSFAIYILHPMRQHQYKIGSKINQNDVKSGSRSSSPRRRAPDYRISIDPWRRKEYLAAAAHQTSTETIICWCAHEITIYVVLAGSDHPQNRACRDQLPFKGVMLGS
jgi:hypothetical protein